MKAKQGWIFGAALAALPVQDAGAWAHVGLGGFSAGRVGEGWAHAGPEGVSAGRVGDGWAHRGYYGGATVGYHDDFVGVHDRYVAGGYPAGGCYNCGVAAAAVGGLAAGAAIASAAEPSTTVVVGQAPGVAVGTQVSTLPGGCEKMTVNGALYYQCGASWYKPGFGDAGVYYQVVPAP